jgi:hypothetical protein
LLKRRDAIRCLSKRPAPNDANMDRD